MNFLFWAGIIFTLSVPILIGLYFDNPSTSWVAAVCGAFVTFIAKLETLAELSLGPVKAKMKETLQEATATIAQLRKVAAITSEATLTDLMAGGFMDGMALAKRIELRNKVIESLNEIGASTEQIKKAEGDWRKGITIIYYRAIKNAIEQRTDRHRVNPDATDAQYKAAKEIGDLLDFENWTAPTPHQIQNVLNKQHISNEQVDRWVRDYAHYIETNEIQRLAEFVKQ